MLINNLRVGVKSMGPDSSQWCTATTANGHKLKHRKFHQNMRKNFFPLRVTEPWPRLPREAVESPPLEIFKPRLDAVLCSLLWVTLLGQGVGMGYPQRSLPTCATLGFCENRWRSASFPDHLVFKTYCYSVLERGKVESSLISRQD